MSNDTVGSPMVIAGNANDAMPPRVTIAIPTFNRPALLAESLASAITQLGFTSYEILIVDNASEPDNIAAVHAMLESYRGPPLRYVVNDANLGMFGNWNRCLALAQGEWITILSDDDLLRPDFLRVMMGEIDRSSPGGALVCRTAPLDQRIERPAGSSERKTSLKAGLSAFLRYGIKHRIRLTPSRLFWGNIAGSSLGCMYRRSAVDALGGFSSDDFPSADYALHLRLATGPGLEQLRAILADVRLQVNESIKPETLLGFIVQNYRYRRQLLAEKRVPARWERWLPRLLAYEIHAAERSWGTRPDRTEVAHRTGSKVSEGQAGWMWAIRALYRGV